MIEKIRIWLLIKLSAGKPVVLNLHLKQGLHIDADKNQGGVFINVNVNGGDYGFKST